MRCVAVLVAVLFAASVALAADPIVGQVRVTDGDTLCVDGLKVRLEGIDAPELRTGQRCNSNGRRHNCGKDSSAALVRLLKGRRIECEPKYGDPFKRFVAACRLAGKEISEEMVRLGWAIDWPRYSNGHYKPAQDEAVAAKRGLWADGIELPPIVIDRMSSAYIAEDRPFPTNEEAKCRT